MPNFRKMWLIVVEKNYNNFEKTWFIEIPHIGHSKYTVPAAAAAHPVSQFHDLSERKTEHNFLYF